MEKLCAYLAFCEGESTVQYGLLPQRGQGNAELWTSSRVGKQRRSFDVTVWPKDQSNDTELFFWNKLLIIRYKKDIGVTYDLFEKRSRLYSAPTIRVYSRMVG